MSLQATLYHSITFEPLEAASQNSKNTWDDWHLVPTSRPKFSMPPVKTQYVDIPGGDGVIDLTTALTGRPHYGNRQGSIEFLVMNDYGDWAVRYSNIATFLHGKRFRAYLDDDPLYYYEGRFTVNEWKSEAQWSRIVLDYNVGPYKYSTLSVGERWLWDPFKLGDPNNPSDRGDDIINYKNLAVNNTNTGLTITYIADIYEGTPVFTCKRLNSQTTFSMTLTYNSKTYTLKTGTNRFDTIQFDEGSNTLVFKGRGIVTIDTIGGRL